jgi:hypothetical protein
MIYFNEDSRFFNADKVQQKAVLALAFQTLHTATDTQRFTRFTRSWGANNPMIQAIEEYAHSSIRSSLCNADLLRFRQEKLQLDESQLNVSREAIKLLEQICEQLQVKIPQSQRQRVIKEYTVEQSQQLNQLDRMLHTPTRPDPNGLFTLSQIFYGLTMFSLARQYYTGSDIPASLQPIKDFVLSQDPLSYKPSYPYDLVHDYINVASADSGWYTDVYLCDSYLASHLVSTHPDVQFMHQHAMEGGYTQRFSLHDNVYRLTA